MKAKLPYFYTLEHRRDDGRVDNRAMVGFLEHTVRELSLSDLDVVASWRDLEMGEQVLCARWNNDLYIPATDREKSSFIAANDLRILNRSVRELYDGAVVRPNRGYLLHEWLSGNRQRFATPRGGSVLSSSEDEDAAEVLCMANGLFVLGDIVWQKVSELHLKIGSGWVRGGGTAMFSSLGYSKNDGRKWHTDELFDVGRWSDHFRIALDDEPWAREFSDAQIHPSIHRIRLFDETAFRFDGRSDLSSRLVDRLERHAEARLGGWPWSVVEAWLDIRESHKAYVAGASAGMPDCRTIAENLCDLEDTEVRRLLNEAALASERYDRLDHARETEKWVLRPFDPRHRDGDVKNHRFG
jgi:hypothetical protein